MTTGAAGANWSGNVTYRASALHTPGSVDELRALVARSPRIRALGSRHSFSAVADTDAELVTVADLPRRIDIDTERRTVDVSAGVNYVDLAIAVYEAGLALPNMGSLPHINVAGAAATGTHGSGRDNQVQSAGVRAIELVTVDGDLVEFSRDRDPETFPGMVLALGALGVVTRLTLDLVPPFTMRQVVYRELPSEHLAEQPIAEVLEAAYSVSMFTRWDARGVHQVWLKRKVEDEAGAGGGATGTGEDDSERPSADRDLPSDLVSPFPDQWRGADLATEDLHPTEAESGESCTTQRGIPGPFHERLPHFRADFPPSSSGEEIQTEYLLPREHAAAAMRAVAPLGEQIEPVLHVSEIRTVAADQLWLSPAYQRDCVGVHFTWKKDPEGVHRVLPKVEEALAPLDPIPHWGKLFTMDPERVRAAHPRADDFVALAAQMDPRGVFRNDFVDTYLAR